MGSTVDIVIVNYNGKQHLGNCLDSLAAMEKGCLSISITLVDNLSKDHSVTFIKENYPSVKVIENTENSYAKALNLAIESSDSDYVALLNNDTSVDSAWLTALVDLIENDDSIGVVQSMILFSDKKTVNSAGVEEVEDYYFRDIGFNEKDSRKYNTAKELDYFSGGSVLFRRQCLESVGPFDEDFIMYCEDVEYSIRCRKNGWKIFYCPKSVLYHLYQGTSSSELCEYFCSRNRMLTIAKHYPERLAQSIATSHFYEKKEFSNLHDCLLLCIKKMAEQYQTETVEKVLSDLSNTLSELISSEAAYRFFSHLELVLGTRKKMTIGIYDHAFQFAGGGQRYVATIAELLQDKYDITYITNKDVILENYKEWFDLDLSHCNLKIIPIQFYEDRDRFFIDEGMVINEKENPFDVIAKESLKYDIFINANMLGKVEPRSLFSVFICHFPDRDIERFFQVPKYDFLISNGDYTCSWIKKRWQLQPSHKLYPPVDMYNDESSSAKKEKIILSVARFERGGSKKQAELVNAFDQLCKNYSEISSGWKLILAGGSFEDNAYFDVVEKRIKRSSAIIELKPNVSYQELKSLYRDAAIFWHACGLNETSPHLIEHFGMTTIESMQNYCVPIVIDGGGQVEIVKHGECGFRFDSLEALQDYTLKVISNEELRKELAQKAYERSHNFNLEVFQNHVLEIFTEIENELLGVEILPFKDANQC